MKKEVETPPAFVFVGREYVQHAASEWRGAQCSQYCRNLFSQIHDLPDAIDFLYGDGVPSGAEYETRSLGRHPNHQEKDSGEEVVTLD